VNIQVQQAPGAPFITPLATAFTAILGTAGPSCTGDCVQQLLADFYKVRFTMVGLTGGTVDVWTYGCER
jgi:hypothetical protein